MGLPLVSYILCVYNGAPFLEEAVASVLKQTYPEIELIIVDDGSTDETPHILDKIRDPRVRVVRQPNMGHGFARNRAVSLARGTYIGSIGQDDVFLPQKTEVQLRTMQQRGWDFCFTWAEIIDGQGHPLDHSHRSLFNQPGPSREEALARLARGNFLCAPSSLSHRRCRATVATNIAFFCLEDYYRWLHLFRQFSGGVIEEPLIKYRIHGRNVSFDARFTPEYRRFEWRAAIGLALWESDPTRHQGLFWTQDQVDALREQTEWLLTTEDPSVGLIAYLVANRALNLSPLDPRGYLTLSRVLSWLGYEYPAALLTQRAERVGSVRGYPQPLFPSLGRRLVRRLRSLLEAVTWGRWQRLEAEVLRAVDRALHPH